MPADWPIGGAGGAGDIETGLTTKKGSRIGSPSWTCIGAQSAQVRQHLREARHIGSIGKAGGVRIGRLPFDDTTLFGRPPAQNRFLLGSIAGIAIRQLHIVRVGVIHRKRETQRIERAGRRRDGFKTRHSEERDSGGALHYLFDSALTNFTHRTS